MAFKHMMPSTKPFTVRTRCSPAPPASLRHHCRCCITKQTHNMPYRHTQHTHHRQQQRMSEQPAWQHSATVKRKLLVNNGIQTHDAINQTIHCTYQLLHQHHQHHQRHYVTIPDVVSPNKRTTCRIVTHNTRITDNNNPC